MQTIRICKVFLAVVTAVSLGLVTSFAFAQDNNAESTLDPELAKRIEAGRAVLEARKKGNCLSCHLVVNSELPGNAGPPLIAMKARWPDREALKSQIFDPTLRNPDSIMPPYGRHRMLTDAELEVLVDFVQSL